MEFEMVACLNLAIEKRLQDNMIQISFHLEPSYLFDPIIPFRSLLFGLIFHLLFAILNVVPITVGPLVVRFLAILNILCLLRVFLLA